MERRTARREALASRRAARESSNGGTNNYSTDTTPNQRPAASTPSSRTIPIHECSNEDDEYDNEWRRSKRIPLQNNLLASLSKALSAIDAQNNPTMTSDHRDSASINKSNNTSTLEHRRYTNILPNPPSSFHSYLHFTKTIIRSILAFLLCYLLVLICTLPMITNNISSSSTTNAKKSTMGDAELTKGQSFRNIRGRKTFLKVKNELGTMKQRAVEWEHRATHKVYDELNHLSDGIILESSTVGRRDGVDALKAGRLLEDAVHVFDGIENESNSNNGNSKSEMRGHDHWEEALRSWDTIGQLQQHGNGGGLVENDSDSDIYKQLHGNQKPGFVVLGMHRSGTSMLSGLLVKGFGYETGGPLIGAAFDNEKGFYERIDIVLQNDEFFSAQQMGWSYNVYRYDSEKALRHKQQGTISFKEGTKGLRFLNNPHKALPYLQKDPRMCITLPTWLELVNQTPAVVFTYRHPMEVAASLRKREQGFTFEHGLRLWIVYNMRALQNSVGLCRVFSTNEAVVKNPLKEVQRIADELTKRCNVIPPPVATLPKSVVEEFVDPKLQHNKEKPGGEEIKEGCVAPVYESEFEEGTKKYKDEREVFLMAMEIFCDLENGDAFKEDYSWPDLETMTWPSKDR